MKKFIILTMMALFCIGSTGFVPEAGRFPICEAIGKQDLSKIAYNDAAKEWLVVWVDYRDNDGADIYAKRVNKYGVIPGSGFKIRDANGRAIDGLDVAFDTRHQRYLVVWGSSENLIAGRMYKANGTPYSNIFNIATSTRNLSDPDVEYNKVTNQYLVVWDKSEYTNVYGGDIYARKVSAKGVVDPSGAYLMVPLGDRSYPALQVNPVDGRYLLVYQEPPYVHGQRLGKTGLPKGSRFTITTTGSLDEHGSQPKLAFHNTKNKALVIWSDGSWSTKGRLVKKDNTLGPVVKIAYLDRELDVTPEVTFNHIDKKFLVVGFKGSIFYGRFLSVKLEKEPIFRIYDPRGNFASVMWGNKKYLVTYSWPRITSDANIFGKIGSYPP